MAWERRKKKMNITKTLNEIQRGLDALANSGRQATLLVTWPDGALLKLEGACSALSQPEGNAKPLSAHLSA